MNPCGLCGGSRWMIVRCHKANRRKALRELEG